MIRAVIIAHGLLGEGLLDAARMILGAADGVESVAVAPDDGPDALVARIGAAVETAAGAEGGAVILTDMFGGTPTNVAMRYVEAERVELVTGVNLPMLIRFLVNRESRRLGELARLLKNEGERSIHLASEVLAGTDRL